MTSHNSCKHWSDHRRCGLQPVVAPRRFQTNLLVFPGPVSSLGFVLVPAGAAGLADSGATFGCCVGDGYSLSKIVVRAGRCPVVLLSSFRWQ